MVERFLEILNIKRSQMFHKPIDLHTLTDALGEGIYSISKQDILNQLGKHNFSCG